MLFIQAIYFMVCYYESIILNFGWLDIWLGIKYLHSIKRYNLEIVQLFARLEYVFDIRSSRNALNEYNKEYTTLLSST